MADLAEQLSGDRLDLRRWTLEQREQLLEAIRSSYDELHLWMSWAASPPTDEFVRDVIVSARLEFDTNERWNFGLFEQSTDECVGSAGLRRCDVPHELEIGYWVRTDRTGRGYATEAASVLTTAAFAAPLNIARVRISMDAANLASARIPLGLGFHLEGEMSREIRTPGHTGHGVLWSVTREKWQLRDSV
jgi:RimJ/RimL family protein N-acetyltransferase